MLPDFIIIGVPKSGSTFLFEMLDKHPEIKGASLKEPHYFDLNYSKGEKFYRGFFPYQSEGKLSGEASVNYFYSKKAAERIKQDLPKVKLILVLRNPVERAYSHFQMNIKDLEEKNFAEIIAPNNSENKRYGFVEKGKYVEYIKTWKNLFSDGQLLVLKSEDLFHDPNLELQKVFRFLNVGEHHFEETKPINQRKYRDLNEETYQNLQKIYEPYNKELVSILGDNFSWSK